MKHEFLKSVSKENKKSFLSKLQTGNYLLAEVYEPQKPLNFNLQESGKYKCKETGQELSRLELSTLKGYRLDVELVSSRLQVTGELPPSSIIKIPFTEAEWLDSMLKNKSDKALTYNESTGKFETENESYSFDDLMRKNSITDDGPENNFTMDEKTAKKYIELLEKWC